MASRLRLSYGFLESRFVPAISLYSGLPTGGARIPMVLKSAPVDAARTPGLSQAFQKQARIVKSKPFALPVLAGEEAKQRLLSKLWILPLVAFPVAGVMAGMMLNTNSGNVPGYVGVGAAAFGIFVALSIKLWVNGRAVEIQLVDDYGTVEVRLPTHLRTVFDAFKAAQVTYEEYRKAHPEDPAAAAGPPKAGDPKAEAWTENVEKGWDEGGSPVKKA